MLTRGAWEWLWLLALGFTAGALGAALLVNPWFTLLAFLGVCLQALAVDRLVAV